MDRPRYWNHPFGRGDLVAFIADKMPSVSFDIFDIDTTIQLLDKINKNDVVYSDFTERSVPLNTFELHTSRGFRELLFGL